MKIILSAFGNLYSGPMDIPESCGTRWDMALIQPPSISPQGDRALPQFPTRCSFEWTGRYKDGCMVYNLSDTRNFKNSLNYL